MNSKHQPATPLPFAVEQPGHQQAKRIVSLGDGETVAGIVSEGKDAEYLSHAANAYPRLVEDTRSAASDFRSIFLKCAELEHSFARSPKALEAVRLLRKWADQALEGRQALLRELGEEA